MVSTLCYCLCNRRLEAQLEKALSQKAHSSNRTTRDPLQDGTVLPWTTATLNFSSADEEVSTRILLLYMAGLRVVAPIKTVTSSQQAGLSPALLPFVLHVTSSPMANLHCNKVSI